MPTVQLMDSGHPLQGPPLHGNPAAPIRVLAALRRTIACPARDTARHER